MLGRTFKLLALALVFASAPAAALGQSSALTTFVTRRGDQLFAGDQQLRFISFNIPNLLVIEDAFEFLDASPWRWPDEFEIRDALESVRQMNGGVVRSYVISVRREGADMGEHVHVLGPGKFNEEAFATLDLVLKIADEKGIRVILPLVDNWKWMGGVEQYAAFRGKRGDEFWTDRQLIDDFKATVKYVVTRRNTLTGQRYCDDKAIFGWETGNEIDATPAWTAELAAYIKELDANHLVIDGRSLHGVPQTSLNDPNVDVVTTHHYPAPSVDVVERITAAAQAARGHKPYFVGEVGFISLDETRRVFDAVIDSNAAGALYWSLRFHRREGGFYWHSEPMGANLFKAYHWPGFSLGDDYDERKVLALIADKARSMNHDASDTSAPAAPMLLPIEHPARISWRGSAGAAGYTVERSVSAAGPWTAIADNVSDAAVQYRPLYCDDSVSPGQDYFYRIIAHNEAGASTPSNVVGPVNVDRAILVDEMNDEPPYRKAEGAVRQLTAETRRVQEDAYRLELKPGGALIYELPGAATDATVWIFADDKSGRCEVLASEDGQEFAPVTIETSPGRTGSGDYGYLRPALLRAPITTSGARYIRIVNSGKNDNADAGGFEVSRVELTFKSP